MSGDEEESGSTKKTVIYTAVIVIMLVAVACMFKGTCCTCGKEVEKRRMARVDSIEVVDKSHTDNSVEINVKT